MNHYPLPLHHSRRVSTAIFFGGLVGGCTGALIRGWFTWQNLQQGELLGLLASFPSAGIGLLCGTIAGALCRPVLGAMVGVGLSAGVFGLFLLPIAYLFVLMGVPGVVVEFSWPYFLQKACAGAIAGAVGGYAGKSLQPLRSDESPPLNQPLLVAGQS